MRRMTPIPAELWAAIDHWADSRHLPGVAFAPTLWDGTAFPIKLMDVDGTWLTLRVSSACIKLVHVGERTLTIN